MACFVLNASAQFSNSGSSNAASSDNSGWNTIYVEWNPSSFHGGGGYRFYNNGEGNGSTGFSGFSLGFSRSISLSSAIPVFIEPAIALQYSTKKEGYFNYYDEYRTSARLNLISIKVPVNFIYKYDFSSYPVSLMPFAGINLRVNAWGEINDDGDHEDLFDEYEFKRFQIGWQAGIKARISDKFIVGGSFGTDFNEIHEKVKVHTGTIMFGYSF
jgi:hypothetical protein